MTRAGLPAAMQLAGIFLVTTEPAAITLSAPIDTPFNMVTPAPIKTFRPIRTGSHLCVPSVRVQGLKL